MKAKKNKIGIITFQGSYNCGSLLQAYALQKYLKEKLNWDNEIINFSNAKQIDMYAVFQKNKSLKAIVKNSMCLPFYSILKRHNEDYKSFINQELILSPLSYSKSEKMEQVEDRYSCLVAGSDQIWNIKCYDADDVYFLNFATHTKKIAYAPSLGAKRILKEAKNPNTYIEYLKDFSFLSVREQNGQKWLKELTDNIEIPILPDPTLLYDKDFYTSLTKKEPIIKGKYIFYYAFHYPHETNKVLKKISKETGMPIITLDAKPWIIRGICLHGFKISPESGPKAFLNLLNFADTVITTSLHGTIFSAIFRKNFWYLKSKIYNPIDDRATFLLDQLGLKSRFIDLKLLSSSNIHNETDFSICKSNISELRIKAYNYLQKALAEN